MNSETKTAGEIGRNEYVDERNRRPGIVLKLKMECESENKKRKSE